MARGWLTAGGIFGLLSVAFGAFGAHTLENMISESALETFHTGAEYQMYHALALVLTGLLAAQASVNQKLIRLAGIFFVAGILLFSGSLYTISLSGIGMFGAVAPLGGTSFMLGWLFLILSVRAFAKKQ